MNTKNFWFWLFADAETKLNRRTIHSLITFFFFLGGAVFLDTCIRSDSQSDPCSLSDFSSLLYLHQKDHIATKNAHGKNAHDFNYSKNVYTGLRGGLNKWAQMAQLVERGLGDQGARPSGWIQGRRRQGSPTRSPERKTGSWQLGGKRARHTRRYQIIHAWRPGLIKICCNSNV